MSQEITKLYETTLPSNYSKVLFEEKNFDLAPEHLDKIFDTLFTGTSELLKHCESTEKPVAVIFRDVKQAVVAAAIVRYFPNEDESKQGNWDYSWTFYENDIPEKALKIEFSSPDTHTYYRSVAGEKYGMAFKDVSCLVNCLICSLEQTKKWLDENAVEGKVIGVEVDGIFKGLVSIEGGEKVFAIEPDGEIKNIIKSDAAIEK